MKKLILGFFVVSFTSLNIFAQDLKVISKAYLLEEVSKNNQEIKINKQELYVVKGDLNQANVVLFPHISLSHTAISTTNPLHAFGSKLNQGILTQNDFNPVLLNNPRTTQNFTSKISINQPLFNLSGLYQRKAIKVKLKATGFKNKRAKEYILFESEKGFYQLQLAYKTVEILKTIKKALLEQQQTVLNYYKQGLIQKTAVLEVELRVIEIENQQKYAKSSLVNASNYLSYFMDQKGPIILKPSIGLLQLKRINLDTYLSLERADSKALKEVSNSYKIAHQAQKHTFLPTLNAFGNYELNSNKLFNNNKSGYLIGFQLNWNILEGTQRIGKVKKSKAQLQKSILQYDQYVSKSNLEYKKTLRAFTDVQNQLIASKKALSQSKEVLRIKKNRFKQGLEKISEVLQSEAVYAQKLLMHYQTIFESNSIQAYLNFLTKE